MAGTPYFRRAGAAVKLLFAAAAGGLVAGAIALPTVGGLGAATRSSIDTFNSLPSVLKDDGTPPQRSTIVASDGKTPIANLYLQNRQVVPLAQIPQVARKALIAIEDSRFYEHHGVDTRGVLRALLINGSSGSVQQGGSTLTQEYVKQVLLYQAQTPAQQEAATADTLARKLKEARLAIALEKKLSKDQILERYMNIAYFGGGAYGIETAALTYFGVHASQLNLPQAAMLAGLVQSPSGYDPYHHLDRALARRHQVLARMHQLGYINSGQMHTADKSPIRLAHKSSAPANGCSEAVTPGTGFFCDYVRSYLTDVMHLTKTQLYNGGLRIRTTLNPSVQAHAFAAVKQYVPMGNKAAAVMDVIQPGTGRVLAMAANRNFGGDAKDPAQTSINVGVRPIGYAGSTYKIFTLAAALQKRVPFGYIINSPPAAVAPNLGYTARAPVRNDSGESCVCDLQRATVQSVNTYFVKLLDSPYFTDDLTQPVRDAQKMGLAPRTLPDSLADSTIRNHRGSFTLGSVPTSPLDMATATATIAANGKMCPPDPIDSITNSRGKQLPIKRTTCEQVLAPRYAIGMSNILRGDADPSVGYNTTHGAVNVGNHAAAGKTGTANESAGLWYVGYTPRYSGSVAIFNPDAPSKPVLTIPGHEGQQLYGQYASQIWQAALAPIIDKEPPSAWPPPAQSVVWGDSVPMPCEVGRDVATASTDLGTHGFPTIQTSTITSTAAAGMVLGQNPTCGTRVGKGQSVTLVLSNGKGKKPKPHKHHHPPRTGPPRQPLPTQPPQPGPPGRGHGGGPGPG